MTGTASSLQINDDLLRAYFWYAGLLVIKMMAMSLLTGRQRFKNKVSKMFYDYKSNERLGLAI